METIHWLLIGIAVASGTYFSIKYTIAWYRTWNRQASISGTDEAGKTDHEKE